MSVSLYPATLVLVQWGHVAIGMELKGTRWHGLPLAKGSKAPATLQYLTFLCSHLPLQ